MPKKTYKPEEIIGKLREAEVRLSQGASVVEVVRALQISEGLCQLISYRVGWRDGRVA